MAPRATTPPPTSSPTGPHRRPPDRLRLYPNHDDLTAAPRKSKSSRQGEGTGGIWGPHEGVYVQKSIFKVPPKGLNDLKSTAQRWFCDLLVKAVLFGQKCEIHFCPPKPPKLTISTHTASKISPCGRGQHLRCSTDQSFSSVLAHFKIRPPRSATRMCSYMLSPRLTRTSPLQGS